jgi:hypothetical protein
MILTTGTGLTETIKRMPRQIPRTFVAGDATVKRAIDFEGQSG